MPHHERKFLHLRERNYTAAEICDPRRHDFVPASVLTHSLTRLLLAVAQGRISPKSATAMARVASILLKSIGESNREFSGCFKHDYWLQLMLDQYKYMPFYEKADKKPDKLAPNHSSLRRSRT